MTGEEETDGADGMVEREERAKGARSLPAAAATAFEAHEAFEPVARDAVSDDGATVAASGEAGPESEPGPESGPGSESGPGPGERARHGDTAGSPGGAAAAVDGPAYAVASTGFDAVVTATARDGVGDRYEVVVQIPSLDAATVDHVGAAVQTGWFETMERRLADAPKSTRAAVDLESFRLANVDGNDDLRVIYVFEYGDGDRAAAIAKTFVEYVEGTYVESTIPGYEYTGTVGELLAAATGTGGAEGDGPGGTGGPTPL